MKVSRERRAPRGSLLGTFSSLVLLLLVARFALLQCGLIAGAICGRVAAFVRTGPAAESAKPALEQYCGASRQRSEHLE